MMRAPTLAVVVLVAGLGAWPVSAQRQTIEIRGQVPTPQIVTVRPRAIPPFPAQVLVPAFYDHQFWPVILPAYQIVSRSDVLGVSASDSLLPAAATPVAGAPAQGAPAVRAPGAVDTAGAGRAVAQPATRNEELEALRRELELRRARIDSIDAARRRELDSLEQVIRERQRRRQPADTTVKPPGTSRAPSR